ncbi:MULTISPECIES: M20/M25/M40 family metallo-hydrolase [unclassified Streptomyces]|uniref:M20/M25/M40 family metallo-hydrolase n=1 Tax=unclassified Streptomyces TaxID=2593676 RepID=UPI000B82633F|nr:MULTISPECIES: M20/M25/M40 family metallo-hydrolase [unclassified Streptomyces]MYZ33615.1 M20/M25/M40 family metallo-hydrolase [Streptomyces sp. SID4917]
MPRARTELAELVAFRSVADPARLLSGECEAAAEWLAGTLRAEGFQDVALLDTSDGTRSVYGSLPGPPASPTVLLYAHYDVRPPLDESAWHTPPFTLTVRKNGRWYGRGAADCKGGILMHLLALRALRAGGGLPVNVKLIVEGAQEQGTGGLERYARAHPELLAADTVVFGDAGNVRAGLPTVTASLRGTVLARVTVEPSRRGPSAGPGSGPGPSDTGPAADTADTPDATAALIRTLASLHDSEGNTVIDGLGGAGSWHGVPYPRKRFRGDAKVLYGVDLPGSGTVADRLWARPSATVVGLDCPRAGSTDSARALVSLRTSPGADSGRAAELLVAHLESHAPWGARVRVEIVGEERPFNADTTAPAYRAMAEAMRLVYGQEMRVAGLGGSIPLRDALADLSPRAEILLIGLGEPEARVHAVNESLDPRELERMSVTEALFLWRLRHRSPHGSCRS